jgi:hypothetical protein
MARVISGLCNALISLLPFALGRGCVPVPDVLQLSGPRPLSKDDHLLIGQHWFLTQPVVSPCAASFDQGHAQRRSCRVWPGAVAPFGQGRAARGSMYSPRTRLASSTARISVSSSGLFMTARNSTEREFNPGKVGFVPAARCRRIPCPAPSPPSEALSRAAGKSPSRNVWFPQCWTGGRLAVISPPQKD